jgi:hypothetical protein
MADLVPKSENGGGDKPAEHNETAVAIEILTLAVVAASIYSARQAKISADAARLSAATAQHAEKQQLRAYVGVNSEPITLRCDACDDPSKPIIEQELREDNSIVIEMQNFGQTPAYDTTVYIN